MVILAVLVNIVKEIMLGYVNVTEPELSRIVEDLVCTIKNGNVLICGDEMVVISHTSDHLIVVANDIRVLPSMNQITTIVVYIREAIHVKQDIITVTLVNNRTYRDINVDHVMAKDGNLDDLNVILDDRVVQTKRKSQIIYEEVVSVD